MTSTETKKRIETLEQINDNLSITYPVEICGKNKCHKAPNGTYFNVDVFPGELALVIEYAETADDASKSRFEDGDLFYLNEMTEDELLEAMRAEIENQ